MGEIISMTREYTLHVAYSRAHLLITQRILFINPTSI